MSSEARDILKRMVTSYQAMKSGTTRSESDVKYTIYTPIMSRVVTVLSWRKSPVGVNLRFQDPLQGTRQFVANSSQLTEYTGVANLYSRRFVSPTLSAIAAQIDSTAPQLLSPLVFLQNLSLPPGIESARVEGHESIGGQRTTMVKGAFSAAFAKQLAKGVFHKDLESTARSFVLWIGTDSNLLVRSSANLAWRGTVKTAKPGKEVVVTPQICVTETFVETRANPVLAPDAFTFAPPKGSEQAGRVGTR